MLQLRADQVPGRRCALAPQKAGQPAAPQAHNVVVACKIKRTLQKVQLLASREGAQANWQHRCHRCGSHLFVRSNQMKQCCVYVKAAPIGVILNTRVHRWCLWAVFVSVEFRE